MIKMPRKHEIYLAGLAILREYKTFLAHVRESEPGHSHLMIGLDVREITYSRLSGVKKLKLKTIDRYTTEALAEAYEIVRDTEGEAKEWITAQLDKRSAATAEERPTGYNHDRYNSQREPEA